MVRFGTDSAYKFGTSSAQMGLKTVLQSLPFHAFLVEQAAEDQRHAERED